MTYTESLIAILLHKVNFVRVSTIIPRGNDHKTALMRHLVSWNTCALHHALGPLVAYIPIEYSVVLLICAPYAITAAGRTHFRFAAERPQGSAASVLFVH